MPSEDRMTVSFVSGKGGVGKTMLAVAFAREMSRKNRTLMVDLDFFNRGLTGLMKSGEFVSKVDPPSFLQASKKPGPDSSGSWKMNQVGDNLYFLSYPDLLPEEMRQFELSEIEVLTNSLEQLLQGLANLYKIQCIVIDCHGGPDNSSFAAAAISDHTVLVSEPDRITFHGTLNFMQQLYLVVGRDRARLWLAFNKVVPAFSPLYLNKFYNESLQQHFDGRPLLGIFPLEVYLTKEFEKTPFLTDVYPFSLLALKTRDIASTMLDSTRPPPGEVRTRRLPGWIRKVVRLSLGKTFPLIQKDFVMAAIVTGLVLFGFLAFVISKIPLASSPSGSEETSGVISQAFSSLASWMDENALFLLLMASSWFMVTILVNWSRHLDRAVTYWSRKRRYIKALGVAAATGILWLFPVLSVSLFATDPFDGFFSVGLGVKIVILIYLGIYMGIVMGQILKIGIDRGQRLEVSLRVVFLLFIVGGPWVMGGILR